MSSLNRTTLITIGCLSFLAGLGSQDHLQVSIGLVVLILLLGLITLRSRFSKALFLLGLFLLGAWRAQMVLRSDLVLTNQYGHVAQFSGAIKDDPVINDRGQLSFKVDTFSLNSQPYRSTIGILTYRQPLKRSNRIAIVGRLKPGFGSEQAELSFPDLQVLDTHLNPLERFRLKFFAAERTAIPEPGASFAIGLLVGARALIPQFLQGQLAAVGLSHLVAVSGYNLTILVNAVRRLLRRASKFLVFGLSLWLIFGFTLAAGISASIVRAASVAMLTLMAGYFGRSFKPHTLIALVAASTAAFNPHALWNDLGWRLSFAAFAGILILAPPVKRKFHLTNSNLGSVAVESISAYLMTLPLLLSSFGTLAPSTPLINLVIMPLVPLAMLLSFIAGLAAAVMPLLSGWLSWPAVLLLRLMLSLIDRFAAIKPVTIHQSGGLTWIWYGLLSLVIVLFGHEREAPSWYNKTESREDVRTLEMA
jgi:ComEC/Rec2-related protein